MTIMRRVELAYSRYVLNNDHKRAETLRLMHQTAADGVDLCDEFRSHPLR